MVQAPRRHGQGQSKEASRLERPNIRKWSQTSENWNGQRRQSSPNRPAEHPNTRTPAEYFGVGSTPSAHARPSSTVSAGPTAHTVFRLCNYGKASRRGEEDKEAEKDAEKGKGHSEFGIRHSAFGIRGIVQAIHPRPGKHARASVSSRHAQHQEPNTAISKTTNQKYALVEKNINTSNTSIHTHTQTHRERGTG
ncbi:hypothetical protein NEPAR04_2218 [Nematocida parisii]|nr:hypothetical protein NEPAR04_2218 [Nematocida parisii]